MRTVLLILAIIAAMIATALGFGFIDDAGMQEDTIGWLALSLVFYYFANLPLDTYIGRRRSE